MAITKATASAVAPAAKGDLVVGSATNDAAVLGVGTNGQLLTVDSTTATGLKWIDAPSGGLTQIATGSFSSTQVVISSIPSTYTFLYLRLVDVTNSTGATPLRMRINGNSNNDYRSTEGSIGQTTFSATSGVSSWRCGYADTNSDAKIFWYTFPFYTLSGSNRFVYWSGVQASYNMGWASHSGITDAITSITIFNDDNYTFNGGSYTLYGGN